MEDGLRRTLRRSYSFEAVNAQPTGTTPTEPRQSFRVELSSPADGHAVVALLGEVDLFTAPRFMEALLEAVDDGADRVTVDLSAVTFVDSTALGVLIAGSKRLQARSGTLDIVCPNQDVRRILEITGLDRVLDIHSSSEQAVRAPRAEAD